MERLCFFRASPSVCSVYSVDSLSFPRKSALAQAVLFGAGMRLITLLAAVAIIGFLFTRQHSPVASVQEAVAQTESAPAPSPAPAASALKRPLDRTHAALDAVKKRNGHGEF